MENNKKKSKPSLIEQAIKVHDWFEATGFEVYPRNNTTVSKEEASIYRTIRRLEEKVVTKKPYRQQNKTRPLQN